jgi:hypothetical protein
MNIASKITALTGANRVSIGENVYKSLDRKVQREFRELSISDGRWKYINYGTDKPYKVYTLNSWKASALFRKTVSIFAYAIYMDIIGNNQLDGLP